MLLGNKFKGLGGIKKHQRSCRVIRGLDKELVSELQNISDFENQPYMNHHVVISGENPMFKTGIKFPKIDEQWNLANSYFKGELPAHEIENKSLDGMADQFNIKVYNCMADNYGFVDNSSDLDNSWKEKYIYYNKHKLKKCLRLLKANKPEDLNDIRFVSKLPRSKVQTEQSSVTTTLTSINHNEMIKSDFWKYVKRFIEKPKKILPTFNQIVCTEYFRKTLQSMNPTKRFTIPSSIPAFKTPKYKYDISHLLRTKRSQK